MSLFKNIIGRGGEDIATEVVSYMLASAKEYIPFQKLFFNRVLGIPASSAQLHAEATTQPSFEVGRPDLIIVAKETLIIVETKLGAYLSGNDQLIRYCELFQDIGILRSYFPLIEPKEISRKLLVFLAPRNTIGLSIQLSNKISKKENKVDFRKWISQQGIEFVPLPWEDLLTDLDFRDSLQNELFLHVNVYVGQELSKEEKMILKDPNVPNAINKVINTVVDIRDFLISEGFKTGRFGQSYNFYGFFIEAENVSCWFGYYLQVWAKYKTPVVLQVRDKWIKKDKNEVLSKLRELGFETESSSELLLPFPVDRIKNWKQDLKEVLSVIFSGLEKNK